MTPRHAANLYDRPAPVLGRERLSRAQVFDEARRVQAFGAVDELAGRLEQRLYRFVILPRGGQRPREARPSRRQAGNAQGEGHR